MACEPVQRSSTISAPKREPGRSIVRQINSTSLKSTARPQGITKSSARSKTRRSPRLAQAAKRGALQHISGGSRKTAAAVATPSTRIDPPRSQSKTSQTVKRKRDHLDETVASSKPKKRRSSPDTQQDLAGQQTPIEHWRQKGQWPKELFEPHPMAHMLAKRKSIASSSRKRSVDGSSVSTRISDEKTREEKSAPYRDSMYEEQLQLKGFYMQRDSSGPSLESINTCKNLLRRKPTLPKDTLFADHLFDNTCENVRNRNESRVIRDLAELIVPSAESLLSRGEIAIQDLIESVNEGWSHSDPITPVRPQPDFSIGFKRTAFTEKQLLKVRPILGDSRTQVSHFRATWYMYFPFLSCEVKCGREALDVADRQNAHSMGIAVRALVDLFQLGKREQEINREILAFSISHDDRYIRIYGYYPIIQADQVSYHRHLIDDINIQAAGGKDRWNCYKFVKSIYQSWAPLHLERIRRILDELPQDITELVKSPSRTSNLSRQIDDGNASIDRMSTTDALVDVVQTSNEEIQPLTPDTSVSAIVQADKQPNAPKRRASNKKRG